MCSNQNLHNKCYLSTLLFNSAINQSIFTKLGSGYCPQKTNKKNQFQAIFSARLQSLLCCMNPICSERWGFDRWPSFDFDWYRQEVKADSLSLRFAGVPWFHNKHKSLLSPASTWLRAAHSASTDCLTHKWSCGLQQNILILWVQSTACFSYLLGADMQLSVVLIEIFTFLLF